MSRSGIRCICEICCCGRHKCPHRPKAVIPWGPCVMSEYTAQYHPQCVEPGKAIVPPSNIFASGDPMSNRTTHRNDYVAYPLEEPYVHRPTPYKAPEGKMENSTLYRNEYTPKCIPATKPMRPPERRQCSAKFDGIPTYRADYRPWELPPIPPLKPKNERPLLPKFDGQPTYRSEYVPKCIQRMANFKPSERPKVYEPFKGDTIYRTEFVPHPMDPPAPIKPPTYSRSRVPFETMTTNKNDFTPKDFCLNPPIRPQQSIFSSTDPMSKSTTNRSDFQDWGPQYPEAHSGPVYKPPEGDQTFDSTYRNDFVEKAICPVQGIKRPEARRCEAKFDGTTNYRHDYTPWAIEPTPSSFKPIQWSPPETPFNCATTNRTSFVPHPCVVVPDPFRPKPTCIENGPFDDRTNYRTEYVPKEVCPCCPAGFLPTEEISPDGFVFDRYDERGHQLYRNVGAGTTQLPVVAAK